MIKEALQYIVGLSKEDILEINERKYSAKSISPVMEPEPKALEVTNLNSLVDYIKSDVDLTSAAPLIVQVCSPTKVEVKSPLFGPFRQRQFFIEAEAQNPSFHFSNWYDQEEFIIAMQSKFQPNDHLSIILSLVGNLRDGVVKTFGDDGISQTVQARSGLAKVEDVIVPNPVELIPYRTFTEVAQPASNFVFRMRSGRETPEMALFEADGGAWKNVAMKNIRDYLGGALAGLISDGKIVLIS